MPSSENNFFYNIFRKIIQSILIVSIAAVFIISLFFTSKDISRNERIIGDLLFIPLLSSPFVYLLSAISKSSNRTRVLILEIVSLFLSTLIFQLLNPKDGLVFVALPFLSWVTIIIAEVLSAIIKLLAKN